MKTVIVAGAVANKCRNGGEAWVRLSWARGLQRLGYDVVLLEQIAPAACVDAAGRPAAFAESLNRSWFDDVTRAAGFGGRAALVHGDGGDVHGMTWPELLDVAGDAELLVNISGHLTLEAVLRRVRRRAYVDIDPGFTQIWEAQGVAGARLSGHDVHFTIGANIGAPDCAIPSAGVRWLHTRQPVVLDDWPVSSTRNPTRFTTVASWRGSYGPLEWQGRSFGLKVHEFRRFLEVPHTVPDARFEIALDIHPGDAADIDALGRHGWQLTDPVAASADPAAFRRYIQDSGAEFSVAQGVYVHLNSGWFSDRSVRYLASGRPVLVQDTGLSGHLPLGDGLLAFRTPGDAAAAARRIVTEPRHHAQAARAIAEQHFDSDVVLARFLDDAGAAA